VEVATAKPVIMIIFLITAASFILAGLITLLVVRTNLTVSIMNNRITVTLALMRCGLRYNGRSRQIGLFCGRWIHYFKSSTDVREKKKKKKKAARLQKPKPRRKLPLTTIFKIIKAAVVFIAGFLSRVQYDVGKIDVQPIIANPALAGMAYGWSRAFYGVFPCIRRILEVSPDYGTGQGHFSGNLELSIKNRQMVGLMWRLFRNLPIIELIKYRFFKKR
jgi:hypothetical protein